MEEYIKRSDVLRLIAKWSDGYRYVEMPAVDMRDEVNALPSTDVVERKSGEWGEENTRPKSQIFICSECGGKAYFPQAFRRIKPRKECRYQYCPNCGAKMEVQDGT